MSCARCKHSVHEEWPKGKTVVRCFCEDAGRYQGRVTEIYRTSRGCGILLDTPAPAWCPVETKKKWVVHKEKRL